MAKQQFGFLNNSEYLSAALKQMLDFIKGGLPGNTAVQDIIFKSKIIITELLTNSLKHSGINSILIDIEISNGDLTIIKTDHGAPLILNPSANHRIPVTNDILHTLYALSEKENEIRFIYEENNMDDVLAIDDIVEHFGLLIITKASNKFIYSYDDLTGSNTFKVVLKY